MNHCNYTHEIKYRFERLIGDNNQWSNLTGHDEIVSRGPQPIVLAELAQFRGENIAEASQAVAAKVERQLATVVHRRLVPDVVLDNVMRDIVEFDVGRRLKGWSGAAMRRMYASSCRRSMRPIALDETEPSTETWRSSTRQSSCWSTLTSCSRIANAFAISSNWSSSSDDMFQLMDLVLTVTRFKGSTLWRSGVENVNRSQH